MSARRVTVEDVARRAGVSTATVSRAVNATAHVAPETLERVQGAIEELGFRPTPAARNLRQQRTRNIALVVPSLTNPFFPELVAGVHPELARRGYSLVLVSTDEPEAEADRVAAARQVDGVLVVGSVRTPRGQALTHLVELPVVAFDRAPATLRTTVVQCDNVAGAESVVTHLLDQGHREVAHVRGPLRLDVADQRARGHRRALAARGVTHRDDLTVVGDFTEESGYAAALRLLARHPLPSAVFVANDLMALGVLAAFREHGVRVPHDVAVAGFDGIRLARYVHPTLTTFRQPIQAIAQHAVRILLDAVEGDGGAALRGPGGGQRVVALPGDLVIGRSSVLTTSTTPGAGPGDGPT